MAQTVQPEVFVNYISQRKKIVVNAHNQPTQLLIQTDYNLNDTLYFKVINVNNQIVELDVNTTYQLYGTYIDARKQVHVLFYTLGVTPRDNMLSFLVNTYTTQYLDYVKDNRTPIDISIVAKQNTGGSTRSYMVLRDIALANPRGYIEGETPTDIVYQNVFNATVPVSGSFGAGQNINLAQDLEGQDLGSFAFGDTLSTNNANQFVIGYNNEPDATKAFIVANSGNIFTVDYEGNVEAGDLNVGAISATSITVSGEDLNQVIDDKVEYLSTSIDDKLSATEDWVSDTFETKESATQTFNELEQDIDSISSFVSGLPTDIALKADQTDLDEANGKIDTISGQVEYLSGAIDQHTSDIGDLNTAVGSKANQTDLEALSTTVEGLAETKADLSAIPTKTSDLTNDSGYITLADVPEGTIYGAGFGLATSGDANNIFYLTGTVLSGSEHISVANNVISLIGEVGKTYTGGTGIEVDNTNNTISLSATIPSAISDLTNDSQFATSAQVSSIVTGFNYLSSITIKQQDLNTYDYNYLSATGLWLSENDFTVYRDNDESDYLVVEWNGILTMGGVNYENEFHAKNIQWSGDFDIYSSEGGVYVSLAPLSTSQITNDSGFTTSAQVSAIASGYAGTGGITSAQVSAIVTGYNYISSLVINGFDYEWNSVSVSATQFNLDPNWFTLEDNTQNMATINFKGMHIYGDDEYWASQIDFDTSVFSVTEGSENSVYISLANPVPLSTSQLTNDSGFITVSDLPSTVYDKLSAGSNITLTKNNQTGVTTIAATGGGGSYPTIKWNDDYDERSFVASSIIFNGFDMGWTEQQGPTDVYVQAIMPGFRVNDGEYENIHELDFDSSEFNLRSSEDYVYVSLANPIPSAISDLTNDSEFATSAQVSSIVNDYITTSGVATGTGLYYNTSDKSLNVNLSADANSNVTISADNNGVVWLSATGGGGITSAQVSAIVTGYNYITGITVTCDDENWEPYTLSGTGLYFSDPAWWSASANDNIIQVTWNGIRHYSNGDQFVVPQILWSSDFTVFDDGGSASVSLANPIPLSTSQLTNDSGFITGYTAGSGIAINNGVISCTVEGGDIKTNKQSISTGSTYNEKIDIVLNEYTPVNSAITLSAFEVPSGALESGVATFEEWVYTTDAFSGVNTTNDVTFIGDTPDEFLPSAYHVFSRRLVNINGTIKQFVSFAYQFESPIIYVPTDPINSPLTFTGKNASNAVCLNSYGSPDAIDLSYSKNDGQWTAYTIGDVISLNQNDTVAFSGNNNHFSKDYLNRYNFTMTGTIAASGNIQSLMNFSNSVTSSCYDHMFNGCTSLTKAPALPVTTLADHCYASMFYSCTNLSSAPQLPATTLADYCYYSMFMNCTSLSTPPQLPATTLADDCYRGMFTQCSNLTKAPVLPATTLAPWCYESMFYNCTNLSSAPQILPATTLAPYCYYYMFYGCSSLSSAPQLSATTLADYCCQNMFIGCSNLSSINVSFTNWTQATNATSYWVQAVAANGTFTKPAALSTEYGDSRIPSGWTVVNK